MESKFRVHRKKKCEDVGGVVILEGEQNTSILEKLVAGNIFTRPYAAMSRVGYVKYLEILFRSSQNSLSMDYRTVHTCSEVQT